MGIFWVGIFGSLCFSRVMLMRELSVAVYLHEGGIAAMELCVTYESYCICAICLYIVKYCYKT
jgi:hypothetical protein